MSRVAKARRKVTLSDTPWQFEEPGPRAEPWAVADEEPAEASAQAVAPETAEIDEEAATQVRSAVRAEIQEYLASLVRRVFLPPPAGTGVRTVLFSVIDGQPDDTRTCIQAADLLARHTPGTVCLVDTHAGTWREGPHDASGNGGHAVTSPLFHAARPLTRNFWRAETQSSGLWFEIDDPKRWFADASARFDYVLVDGRAVNPVGEPSPLASLVDGVILLVDERATRREAARSVADALQRAGARLLGVVLTNRSCPIPARLYRRL